MQAKIVFRGSKCFREFDLKTVAEKLGLSIDDFNHFALAVDEKNEKTVYASVYAQVPLFETQCSAINVSGWLFDRVFNLVDAELPNKEHPDITTMVYAGDTWSEPEEWIAHIMQGIAGSKDGEATTYKDTNANSIAAGKCKFVAKNSGILFV